jgi:transposase
VFEESTMGKTRRAYPPEFRRQMIELVHAGRSPEELAHGDGGLTTAEREELNRLRRENRQLRLERKILSNACPGLDPGAAAWFARETNAIPARGSGS